MQINGLAPDLTIQQLQDEIDRGGRFVMYSYTISLVVVTLRRPSDIYFIPGGHSRVAKGLGFALTSLVLGWWGIPWGPIYTVTSLCSNLTGGKDVTDEVVKALITPSDAERREQQRQSRVAIAARKTG